MRRLTYAAPFLVAIFTVVSLYAANAERLSPGDILIPLAMALPVAGVFLLLFWLLKWTTRAAPLVASVWTGIVLSWNMIPVWIAITSLIAVMCFVVLAPRLWTHHLTSVVVLTFVISVIVSSIQVGTIEASKDSSTVATGPTAINPDQENIYFIIPDRMPSAEAMRESGINPDQALADFRSMGFHVDEDQQSSDTYTWDWPERIHSTRTMRYLASTLNGGAAIPIDIAYRDCRQMITDNAVFTWLHAAGYTIAVVPSWFIETQSFTDQDEIYPFTDVGILERVLTTELGEAFFERTILHGLNLRVMESWGSQVSVETARHRWQAAKILELASSGRQSLFVFAHLTLPHEPYVYGNPADTVQEQYAANIRFALDYLVELATMIRAADSTATILIQSDEGMAYSRPAEANYELSQRQWTGTFNAWHWPEANRELDSISSTEILGVVAQSR